MADAKKIEDEKDEAAAREILEGFLSMASSRFNRDDGEETMLVLLARSAGIRIIDVPVRRVELTGKHTRHLLEAARKKGDLPAHKALLRVAA